jgi:TonB family protein
MQRLWLVLTALCLTALCLTAPVGNAQTVVAGQVVHRAKRGPLPNVAVELLGARDTVLATATTAVDGTFTLAAPAGGTYRVRLTAPGAEAHVSDSLSVTDGEYAAREFPIDPEPRPYFEFQVDRAVIPVRSPLPRYPDELRSKGISGCVLVQFVVDTTGRADTTTFKVLRMSHLGFAQAARAALPGLRYTPAELQGRKVRQLVQQPFDFSIEASRRTLIAETRRVDMGPAGGPPPPPPTPTMTMPPPPLPPPPAMCGSGARR